MKSCDDWDWVFVYCYAFTSWWFFYFLPVQLIWCLVVLCSCVSPLIVNGLSGRSFVNVSSVVQYPSYSKFWFLPLSHFYLPFHTHFTFIPRSPFTLTSLTLSLHHLLPEWSKTACSTFCPSRQTPTERHGPQFSLSSSLGHSCLTQIQWDSKHDHHTGLATFPNQWSPWLRHEHCVCSYNVC